MAQEPAETLTRPSSAPSAVRASEAAYTRTDGAPQRAPRFPDTPWGQARGATGWSLRELSRRTGINPGELSRIERERGGGATPDQALRLLRVYGMAS